MGSEDRWMCIGLLGALLALGDTACSSFVAGSIGKQLEFQKEAVNRGFAEYVPGEEGESVWRWKGDTEND